MAAFAFSVIKELTDNGVKIYQPGEKLEGLSKDRVEHLLKVGAAATYDRTKSTGDQVDEAVAEQDTLRKRIAELEAQLAEKSKSSNQESAKQEAPKASSAQANK